VDKIYFAAIIIPCIFAITNPLKNMNLKPLSEAALIAEYNLITETLAKTKFNKRKAAELLQVDPKTIYNRIAEYHAMMAKKEAKKEPIPTTH
jgi:two-component system response regulator HydG